MDQPKPEASEIEAIKLFCASEVQKRQANDLLKKQVSKFRAVQSEQREKLTEYMKNGPYECVAISRADALRLDAQSNAEGLQIMPRYLRLIKTNKDTNITSEIIKESLQSITIEDIKENMTVEKLEANQIQDALKQLILKLLRRNIRSFNLSLKLVTSSPSGQTLYDLPEAPSEISDQMWTLWNAEQSIKKLLSDKPKLEQGDLKERIENYFIRTGLTSQRIVVESKPWRLVRKVSIKKMRIGIGRIEHMLDDALKNQSLDRFNASEIIHFLQVQISSLPPETKTSVGLCAVKD
jgi:hypothetical protein